MSSWSPDVYARAWDFATRYHHGQTYGGAMPGEQVDYIHHIGSVAMEVLWVLPDDAGLDGDLAVQCALLHDVLEDTDARYETLHELFGPAVATGVLALTKDDRLDKGERMTDSLRRICQQPREVWVVKMADRITNLYQPPFYWDVVRIEAYRQEAIQIYQALHPANARLAQRLSEKIERYRGFLNGRA